MIFKEKTAGNMNNIGKGFDDENQDLAIFNAKITRKIL